ncbi:hypothetical protein PFISCL1PPCAC_14572 [Pristionchus fissidentatus]|uniref:RING-type domain-containing protein n=1 Tax=Pristionchus fissidentatus TaxID=1538716 RepID=A0AAV5VXR5_9BILA|nr:hypothetical protein PFISCL1PPCAC_14572 [Pristionchus fissidentatus]
MEKLPLNEKLHHVYSLSPSQLADIVYEWHCADGKCKGPSQYNGGFGLKSDNDRYMIPYVLKCGHYICGFCKDDHINTGKSYDCGYNFTFNQSDCNGKMTVEELRNAPEAKHITGLISFFRPNGIICDYCTYKEDKKTRANSKTIVRYPLELMRAFFHKKEGTSEDVYDIGEEKIDGVPVAEIAQKKKDETRNDPIPSSVYRPMMCVWCSIKVNKRNFINFFNIYPTNLANAPADVNREVRVLAENGTPLSICQSSSRVAISAVGDVSLMGTLVKWEDAQRLQHHV